MSTKHTSECLKKAGDDEPIFVLRAQDKFAPTTVRLWAELMLSLGSDNTKYIEARELADKMEEWQQVTGICKSPD